LHFEKDYPNSKIVILEQNYRSTKNILAAANSIIEKNKYRVPKNLFTEKEEGETINICETYDETNEAEYIAETISELLKNNDPEKIAVLYRANFQSRVLEEALLNHQIPYQVLGVKFFERKEVKDLLAYARASFNKESWSDIKRIINVPARGIGKVTLAKVFAGQFVELPATMQEKINKFYFLLDKIREFIEKNKTSDAIKFIIEKTGLEEKLSHGGSDEQEELENMKELVTLSLKYDPFPPGEGMEKLLEDASLASDQDTLMHKGKGVRLMTVHAAKGLEFKYVFVTGLEQDLFPHARTDAKSKEDQEEERRLFYVALTRAEKKLYLSYAQLRTIFGTKQVNSPSEFLSDIPEHLTSFEQAEYKGNEKIIYI
jgi:DNA helicase-2/ATP-dependent DNA helicase PcrA